MGADQRELEMACKVSDIARGNKMEASLRFFDYVC